MTRRLEPEKRAASAARRDARDAIPVHQLDIRHEPCNFVELFDRLRET